MNESYIGGMNNAMVTAANVHTANIWLGCHISDVAYSITDQREMHVKKINQKPVSRKFTHARMMLATAVVFSANAGMAIAQSNVQIFGIIDTGILYQSKSPGNGGSQTQMATSGLRQTVLGFKGTEQLDNGLKAFFNLESHFDTNNGALHGTGDAPGAGTVLFRRQANVGLSGNFGTFIFGRQYGPALLAHLGTEPRAFKEQFSNLYAWAYNQYAATASGAAGLTNRNTNNDVGIFFNNAIHYRNKVGPVDFGILYSLGGVADSTSKNSALALGANYTGPFTLSGSYQEMKDQTSGVTLVKHSGLGFAVPISVLTFKANFLEGKNYNGISGAEVSKVHGLSMGIDYKWHPANSLTLAYYDNKDKDNNLDHTKNVVISNDYSLSKRTTIYTQWAYVDAKAMATIKTSIVAAGIPAQGEKTSLLNVGINHTF